MLLTIFNDNDNYAKVVDIIKSHAANSIEFEDDRAITLDADESTFYNARLLAMSAGLHIEPNYITK